MFLNEVNFKTLDNKLSVYELGRTGYRVVYKTKLQGNAKLHQSLYKKYLLIYVKDPLVKILFDYTKGICIGMFIIPKSDACSKGSVLGLGITPWAWHIAAVRCIIKGRKVLTLYTTVESNQTEGLQVDLEYGIKLSTHFLQSACFGGRYIFGFYFNKYSYKNYVVLYHRINNYQPVDQLIHKKLFSATFWHMNYDFYSNFLFLFEFPGPRALAYRQVYEPKDGLLKIGSGRMLLEEITTSFNFKMGKEQENVDFYSSTGKWIHFVRTSKRAMDIVTSVELYRLDFE